MIGDRRVSSRAAGSIGEILGVKTEVLDRHPLVDARRFDQQMDDVSPLAGLLLEPALGVKSIDFVHPRQAPDLAGRRRQLTLGGVGLLTLLALGGWTVARFNLQAQRQQVEAMEMQHNSMQAQYYRYGRDRYKLQHLQHAESVNVDWLDHLARIVEIAPGSDQLVLDLCAGSLSFGGVKFDRKTNRWSAPSEVRIVIEGEATDRATADAFRGALVAAQTYRISTAGPDAETGRRLPYSFNYQLRSTRAAGSPQRQETQTKTATLPPDTP